MSNASNIKKDTITAKGFAIQVYTEDFRNDYVSLTDIARYKNKEEPNVVVANWMRNYSTIEYLGIWERLNNPNFKPVEFEGFLKEAGSNAFTLSPKKWSEITNAIGLLVKSGRGGGTYAHKDIAFEFASWVSPYFKLYLIKEFECLKEEEQKKLGWDIKRNLAKINYRIHTDAIKNKLVPDKLSKEKINFIYASEEDILNVSLFGITAKEWRDENPDLKGNIRDYADISQLVCLSNLENLNAVFINEGMSQSERLEKLNAIAIEQMKILSESESIKKLK